MDFVVNLSNALWNPLAYVALAVGFITTAATAGVVFRRFPDMLKGIFEKKDEDTGTSPFQALMMTMAGRVGVGNIAGVAIAVFAGGPGALFWMFFSAIFSTGTAFAETVLGQVYKKKIEGEYRGGAPFYIEAGLKKKWLAVLAAIVFIVSFTLFIPGIQANSLASGVEGAFGIPTWVTGVSLIVMLAIIAIGGTERIAKTCQLIVPILGAFYIGFAIYVLIVNYDQIWGITEMVFASAFGYDAVFGALLGTSVAWGVRRSLYSNAAGSGESAFASSSASVSHPVKQGLVQAFSAFATIVIAMATGVMLLVTQAYNVANPSGGFVIEHLPGIEEGTPFTQAAIDSVIPGFGPGFIAIALFFFAFTTLVSYVYVIQTNLAYLRGTSKGPIAWFCLALLLGSIYYGSVSSAGLIWAIGDVAYAAIAWLNIAVILLLLKVVMRVTKDYDRQKKLGLDPVFDPAEAKVTNAEYWEEYAREHQKKLDLGNANSTPIGARSVANSPE